MDKGKSKSILNKIFSSSLFYISPTIILLALTTIFPFIFAVYLSFNKYDLRFIQREGVTFLGLTNFISLLNSSSFWASVETTVIYVGGALLAQIVLGVALAMFLDSLKGPFQKIKSVIFIPMMLTPVVVATTFRLLYNYDFGLIGYIIESMGFVKFPWLAHPFYARLALIISDVWQWTPLITVITLGALQVVPDTLLESAELDGAGWLQKFRYVVLPIIMPIVGVGILLRFMDIVKFFDKIYVLTGGGPGMATETLTYHIYQIGFNFMRLGRAAAASILLLIGIIIISMLLVKFVVQPDVEV